jgi:hypothetical protein
MTTYLFTYRMTSENIYHYKYADDKLTTKSRLKESRRYLMHRIPAFRSAVCILVEFLSLNNTLILSRKLLTKLATA